MGHDKIKQAHKTKRESGRKARQEDAETVRRRAKILNVSLDVAAKGHAVATHAAAEARIARARAKKAQKTAQLLQISIEHAADLNTRAYHGDLEAIHQLKLARRQRIATQLETTSDYVDHLQHLADEGDNDAKATLRAAVAQIVA